MSINAHKKPNLSPEEINRSASDMPSWTSKRKKTHRSSRRKSSHSKNKNSSSKEVTDVATGLPIILLSIPAAVIILCFASSMSNGMRNYMSEVLFIQQQENNIGHNLSLRRVQEKATDLVEDLASPLNGLKNVLDQNENGDVPVLWYVSKSGGSGVKNALGKCYSKILTSVNDVKDGKNHVDNIQYQTHGGLIGENKLDLIGNHIKNLVIISPWLHDIDLLFMEEKYSGRGRIFGIFRDPIERTISLFHYLQHATWEPSYNPLLSKMTLEQYAGSRFIDNNVVTRTLTGKYSGSLTSDDLATATVILRSKILVGLQSKIEESMIRYEQFFGLTNDPNYIRNKECRQKSLPIGTNANIEGKFPEKNSRAYELLYYHNKFDMQVYDVAVSMFDEQESLFRNIRSS